MRRRSQPDSERCAGPSRREMMRVSGLSAFGLSLPELLATRAVAGSPSRPAKSCIVLFLMGGPPQHSTWDPKPDAPAEVRGEIGPCDTTIAGVQFGELMPL